MNVPFKKKLAAAIFLSLLSIVIMLVLLSTVREENLPDNSSKEDLTPVKTIRAQKGSLDKILRLNGYIQSDDVITVIPFVSGTLEKLYVDIGQRVEKNQLIAEIDSRAYDLQLKQAEAAYLGAESSFKRIEQLYKSNAATRSDYDQIKSQYDAYKSQLELAELQVSYTKITSPIDGTVLKLHSNKGSLAAPELPILTIGDLSNLIVKIGVPDKYYEIFRTSPDMKIQIFRPRFEEKKIDAAIKNISPVISPQTRNFEIVCELDGDISSFRPGMFVYCSFIIDQIKDVFYLPHQALGAGGTLWYVEPVTSTAEKIEFTRTFTNDSFFSIPAELSEYEYIIEGQSFLTSGQKVYIK